jgi:hypothetical protein
MSLTNIYEGWRNKLFPPEKLKLIIEHTAADRMAICYGCEFCSIHHNTLRPDVHCMDCGCTLSAKTACLSCECPKQKWMPVVTNEQEQEIKKSYEDNQKGARG